MATNVPAMREGKFGTTEYFLLTMKAGELITKLTIPKEMKGSGTTLVLRSVFRGK